MRKKFLLPAAILVLAFSAFAFNAKNGKILAKETVENKETGIQFIEQDWSKALTEAKKQNKLIFLDAYATWCGPCKLLKRNTFPDAAAGVFFNKNFINVAVDMEKGVGPELLQKYQVNAFPTLIITDADGKPVTYTQGYMEAKQLIEFGAYGLMQHSTGR